MDTDAWYKPFFIASVCRADLQQMLSEEELAALDDTDMQTIADKMGDAYCENGFWIDLDIIARHVLSQKGAKEAGS